MPGTIENLLVFPVGFPHKAFDPVSLYSALEISLGSGYSYLVQKRGVMFGLQKDKLKRKDCQGLSLGE